ncbi:MAG: MOSC domain-containing protein [Burkholderiales bacterium]|jgi:MOSC domain-containing protein YiiM|nr:MOSC domain-containing protein [Burkholderiales bacterium]
MSEALVAAVWASATHSFSKFVAPELRLIAGQGVEGDAHCGVTVKHRSRVAQDPTQPNLRQVHLIQGELFDELAARGFGAQPGELGENLTTRGIDLLALPRGTELHVGPDVVLRVTGLRNPCPQIENFEAGLLKAVVDRDADGEIVRKAGIMSIVLTGGVVKPGDAIGVRLPPRPHQKLERV